MRNRIKQSVIIVFMTILVIVDVVICQAKPAYARVKLNKKTVWMTKGGIRFNLMWPVRKKKVKWSD